ncbi:MAG: hypothetical protein AB1715_00035 [Acidobacteriota bacterium]
MKTLVWIFVIGLVAFFVYDRFIRPGSQEESQVRALERDFNHATDRFISAMRGGGEPGFAVITDPETAARSVREIRRKVTELIGTLTEEAAIAKAQKLEARIIEFCQRHEID